jgi:cytochrome P450
LFLAGHETTASTVAWAIYELARNPEYQTLVRAEIKATREQAATRGDNDLLISDLDSMKYLLSLMKVCPLQMFMSLPELRGYFS